MRLMLWDTAGQEEFDAITKAYYRGAQACVVAFSTTDRASFDAVVRWKNKVSAKVQIERLLFCIFMHKTLCESSMQPFAPQIEY